MVVWAALEILFIIIMLVRILRSIKESLSRNPLQSFVGMENISHHAEQKVQQFITWMIFSCARYVMYIGAIRHVGPGEIQEISHLVMVSMRKSSSLIVRF